MREINERRVIDALRSHGALHAAEIARMEQVLQAAYGETAQMNPEAR